MSSKFAVGDKVVLTGYYGGYLKGTKGTVTEAFAATHFAGRYLVRVKPDTGGREFDAFEYYLEKAAAVPSFKVGDRVRVDITKSRSGWFRNGVGTVTATDGKFARVKQPHHPASTEGRWLQAKEVDLVPAPAEKPKAELVTEGDSPAVGDTVVAFWDNNGVEYRQKGVVASIDQDGTLVTKEGNFINLGRKSSHGIACVAEHVYIVSRAPKPKPLAHQKYIDAPVGSIAISPSYEFQWSKTAEDEWTFFCTDSAHTFRDRTDATVGQNDDTFLVTF